MSVVSISKHLLELNFWMRRRPTLGPIEHSAPFATDLAGVVRATSNIMSSLASGINPLVRHSKEAFSV